VAEVLLSASSELGARGLAASGVAAGAIFDVAAGNADACLGPVQGRAPSIGTAGRAWAEEAASVL
jgi:hypothetical protein